MATQIDMLRDTLNQFKDEYILFVDKYYTQIIEIWRSIERLETKQKSIAAIYGVIGGAIPTSVVLAWILIKG